MRSTSLKYLAAAVVAVVVASQPLHAQMCSGSASFRSGPMSVAADANFGENVKAYGASFGVGASGGAWINGSASMVKFDDVSESGSLLGVTAGYSMPMNPQKTVEFCPLAGFQYQSGPNFGNFEISDRAFSLGGTLGGMLTSSPDFDVVPFASGQLVMENATTKTGSFSSSDSQNYGVISLGAGFIINKVVTIRPIVNVPVGLDGAKASYGVGFAYNFGK